MSTSAFDGVPISNPRSALPGLPGVRKVGPDSLTRRCSDQGCNFGTRAGLNSAAIPALRALDTADTGSPFAKKPGLRNIRRKVRPDIATFARSRQSDLDRSVNFYRDVFECHVALHESEAALLLTPGGFQIYFRAHETPDTRHRRCGRRADHLVRRQRSRTATDRTTPAHALSQYLHQHPERDHSRRRRRPRSESRADHLPDSRTAATRGHRQTIPLTGRSERFADPSGGSIKIVCGSTTFRSR